VVTLGVDLSAQPKGTAWCVLRWSVGSAEVIDLGCGADDDKLLSLFPIADKVAVDVPFGWPDEFVKAISAHHQQAPWPRTESKHLTFRVTDRFVHQQTGRWPLSVSSDRIGITAMRAARLLSTWSNGKPFDRAMDGHIIEVYPAAALRMWGFSVQGYKGVKSENRDARVKLLAGLCRCATWLRLTSDAERRCVASDDELDSLIAAIVARASILNSIVDRPGSADPVARREGWIHLPTRDSLSGLANAEA